MTKSRTAVIVGAGVGGMCAGALLARRGWQVTVVERIDQVGGRARTQNVGGYLLPRGAVAFQLTGALPKICQEVGAEFEVRPVSETWFWIKGDEQFVQLPGRGGIKKMLEMFSRVHGGDKAGAMAQVGLQMAMARIGSAFKDPLAITEGEDGPTFREWLQQHTDNAELLGLFHAITSAVSAVNDFEYPARHWFAHFSSKALDARVDEFGLVAGGYQAVASALADVIRECGGQVRLATPVQRILAANGRATGVEVIGQDGKSEVIAADVVISNAGPSGTLALAGDTAVGADYADFIRRRVRPTPIVLTYVVSDEPLFAPRASILAAGLQRIVTARAAHQYLPRVGARRPPHHELLRHAEELPDADGPGRRAPRQRRGRALAVPGPRGARRSRARRAVARHRRPGRRRPFLARLPGSGRDAAAEPVQRRRCLRARRIHRHPGGRHERATRGRAHRGQRLSRLVT